MHVACLHKFRPVEKLHCLERKEMIYVRCIKSNWNFFSGEGRLWKGRKNDI